MVAEATVESLLPLIMDPSYDIYRLGLEVTRESVIGLSVIFEMSLTEGGTKKKKKFAGSYEGVW